MTTRTLRSLAGLVLVAGIAVGCSDTREDSSNSGAGAAAIEGGEASLTVAASYTINPDPDVFFELEGNTITSSLYEGLVRAVPGSPEIEPWLAESYEISPDGLTYTFKLREGLTFADGSALDSAAVQAAFERRQAVAATPSYMLAEVAGYETPDPTTFVVKLTTPVNNFIARLASPCGPLITNPAEIAAHDSGGDLAQGWLKSNAAGSGPYVVQEWVPDERVVLARNENYWGEAPPFDQVVFRVIPDTSSQRLQVEQGDVDLMWGVSPQAADELESSDAVEVESLSGYNMMFGQINLTKAPFDDVAVRSALVQSIPFEEMVGDVFGTHATVADQMAPEGRMPEGMATFEPVYDANAFAEATAGVDKSMTVVLGIPQYDEGNVHARIVDYVAEVIRGAGFEVEIRPTPTPDYFGMVGAPELAPNIMLSTQPDDGVHPDNWFRLWMHTAGALNVGGVGLPETDALMDEANATPPSEEPPYELYSQASDTLRDQVHFIPIADVPTIWVHANDLTNLKLHLAIPQALWISELEPVTT